MLVLPKILESAPKRFIFGVDQIGIVEMEWFESVGDLKVS